MWIDDHMLLGVIATREPYARGAVGVPGLGLGRGYAPVALILVPGLGDAIHLAKRVAEGRDVAPPGRRHDLVQDQAGDFRHLARHRAMHARSDTRRVGTEEVSTCRSRGAPRH